MSERQEKRRTARGVVERGPKDKTISVKSMRLVRHARYRRYVRRMSVYKVHDALEQASQGDVVEIMETRPISKTKHWRLVRIISRRAEKESEAEA